MGELILVTGGARSGKSTAALKMTEGFERRVFIATAEAFDEEMRRRIDRHQSERGMAWDTVEAQLDLASAINHADAPQAAIVIDCLTVWIGNLMYHDPSISGNDSAFEATLTAIKSASAERIVIVTNEVGMGIVPANSQSRRYRDLVGQFNQAVAELADRVFLMVCGQAVVVNQTPSDGAIE